MSKTFFAVVFALFAVCNVCNSQRFTAMQACPSLNASMKLFDLKTFSGNWYAVAKNPDPNPLGVKCDFVEYKLNETSLVLNVKHGSWNNFNNYQAMEGKASVVGCPAEGVLTLSFDTVDIKNIKYRILGTDYTNWGVVYFCNELKSFNVLTGRNEYFYILSKTRKLAEVDVQKAYAVLDMNKIDRGALTWSQQNGC